MSVPEVLKTDDFVIEGQKSEIWDYDMARQPKQNNITTIIEEERGLTGRGSQEVNEKMESDEKDSDEQYSGVQDDEDESEEEKWQFQVDSNQ